MATFKAVNKTNLDSVPQKLGGQGEHSGQILCMYDEYAPAAAVANSSIIQFGALLPNGARVLDTAISFPDQGTTGTGKLGWSASSDAVEAANDAGFQASISFKAAADSFTSLATDANVAGIGKRFTAPVQTIVTLTEAIDVGTGLIKVWVYYIID